MSGLKQFKNLLLVLFLYKNGYSIYIQLLRYGLLGAVRKSFATLSQSTVTLLRKIPKAESLVRSQIDTTVTSIHKDMLSSTTSTTPHYTLPTHGLTTEQVIEELDVYSQLGNVDWRLGKISGTVYHGGKVRVP